MRSGRSGSRTYPRRFRTREYLTGYRDSYQKIFRSTIHLGMSNFVDKSVDEKKFSIPSFVNMQIGERQIATMLTEENTALSSSLPSSGTRIEQPDARFLQTRTLKGKLSSQRTARSSSACHGPRPGRRSRSAPWHSESRAIRLRDCPTDGHDAPFRPLVADSSSPSPWPRSRRETRALLTRLEMECSTPF